MRHRFVDRVRVAASRHPHAEVGVAVVVLIVTLATTRAGTAGGRLDATVVTYATVACGALVARLRFPLAALLLSASAAEGYLIQVEGHYGGMVLVAPLIALYTVAELSSRRRSLLIGAGVVLVFAVAHMLIKPASPMGADNLALGALGGLAVAAGLAARHRRAYLSEVEARARHAEADREAETARRVTEERLRIARDLHDVIGHQLALIHVQSGVAAHVLADPPAQARDALAHISAASRTALGELRDTVGLLRQAGETAIPTEPVVGLAGLAPLLATFRRSGLSILENTDGVARPIAIAADLTAYRVIQESLTNVCRHAGPTTVHVRLTYRPDTLSVVIENGGAVVARVGDGHGLAGMRERVTALGGRLAAGPRATGGFRVAVDLPSGAVG